MQLRDAVTPIPDHSFARRVAVATGITTAIAIGGAIAAIAASSPRPLPSPKQLPTLAVASMYGGPAEAQPADIALANHELHAYAFETYPSWVAANPDRECPRHLLELNHYAPTLHAVDPWGSPYQLICGKQYGRVLSMRSAGPDRLFDTTDDLSTAP
ncbi:MAG: hypothetical protein M4D80_09515 [Myxococcota bacterium]|nr:hypothetical protein [Myxococcota bacterium]